METDSLWKWALREVVVSHALWSDSLPQSSQPLEGAARFAAYLSPLLTGHPVEHCLALLLDNGHRPIGLSHLGMGTSQIVISDLKRLVRAISFTNAALVVIAHNHPGGPCVFSPDDRQMTWRTAALCKLVQIQLLDHLIIGHEDWCAASQAYPNDLSVELEFVEDLNTLYADRSKSPNPAIDDDDFLGEGV